MIKVEYTLVKWKDGVYREMPITIQQEAEQDFCEMMGWDERDFSNNTIRRPICCENEDLINSVQKIKPIIIDPAIAKGIEEGRKHHPISEARKAIPRVKTTAFGKKKRKRRTKEEMDVFKKSEQTKEKSVPELRTKGVYPKEMKDFCERHMNQNSNQQLSELVNETFGLNTTPPKIGNYLWLRKLRREYIISQRKEKKSDCQDGRKKGKFPKEMYGFIERHMETNSNQALTDLINEKWDIGITMDQVKNYMKWKKLRRVNIIRSQRRSKEELEKAGEKKKMGPKKKWTDEVVQYLKDNINNFSNKELCEELESQFNLKTSVGNLSLRLSQKGIKRDIPEGQRVDPKIVDFVSKSKIKEVYAMRDEIIEKFETDVPIVKLRPLMKKDLPGESVSDEVRRIEQKREFGEDNDIDDIL